jgi:aminoglycoside/choline kinase family phosphotransferase
MTPAAAESVEADRMVHALQSAGMAVPSAELVGMEKAPIGIGAMADTFRIQLTWSEESAGPRSLVIKKPYADPAAAATAASLGAYEREAKFYVELAPRTAVRAPRLLGVELDDGIPSTVLLEDLSEDYHPGDQFAELALPLLRQARHQLVLLQAPFWQNADTANLDWLHRRLGVPIPAIVERMQRSWSSARSTIGSGLTSDERACVDRFVSRAGEWASGLNGPCSLVHHDYRVDNMLFGQNEIVVLDWQTIGWGPAMFDVAYLLGTSLEPERRRAVERDEIARHVDELAQHGVDWDAAEAWQAYRQAAFAVLLMLVPPIASVKTNARMEAMYGRLIAFGARMAIDLDALDLLPA